MKPLKFEDIEAVDDKLVEKVEIPEWDGFVFVKTMSGKERSKWQQEQAMDLQKRGCLTGNKINWAKMDISFSDLTLLVQCVIDEEGKNLFTIKNIPVLGGKSAKALNRMVEVAKRLNGLGDEEKRILENFGETPQS